jgi:hypothetical protein
MSDFARRRESELRRHLGGAALTRREFIRQTAADTVALGALMAGVAELRANPLGLPIGSQTYPHRALIKGLQQGLHNEGFELPGYLAKYSAATKPRLIASRCTCRTWINALQGDQGVQGESLGIGGRDEATRVPDDGRCRGGSRGALRLRSGQA